MYLNYQPMVTFIYIYSFESDFIYGSILLIVTTRTKQKHTSTCYKIFMKRFKIIYRKCSVYYEKI